MRAVLIVLAAVTAGTVTFHQIADAAFRREPGINRAGGDYRAFFLAQPRVELCEQACAKDPKCKAFVFESKTAALPAARCWLKGHVPGARKNSCCIAGVRVATPRPLALPRFARPLKSPFGKLAPPTGLFSKVRSGGVSLSCAGPEHLRLSVQNASGLAPVVATFSCFPYLCSASKRSCETRCLVNKNCGGGFDCKDGRCVARHAFCSGRSTSASTSGTSMDCGAYGCNPVNGLCNKFCTSITQCADNAVCDGASRACVGR